MSRSEDRGDLDEIHSRRIWKPECSVNVSGSGRAVGPTSLHLLFLMVKGSSQEGNVAHV